MAKLEDAEIASLLFDEIAAASIATPAADLRRLFVDTDGLFKYKDETGAVTAFGAPAAASQVEMEAGTEAALRSVSPLRVAQAIAALGGGGGDAWTEIVKGADQTVTNSTTLTADTELTFATVVGTYEVEFMVLYSGNDTAGDYKWQFSCPAVALGAQLSGWSGAVTTSLGAESPTGRIGTAGTPSAWPSANIGQGTDAAHSIFTLAGFFLFTATATGNVTFQFANVAASAGRESTTKAGSLLRYRLL